MIYVDRSRVPMPSVFGPAGPAEEERRKAEAFYLSHRDRQRRFEFRVYRTPEVRLALDDLFHKKCAYCETPFVSTPGDVEMFRPKSAVAENASHPGYWWLATEWSNLLISCPDCNRRRSHTDDVGDKIFSGKANRFPLVDESVRAFGPEDSLERESPLLLDPCRDDPNEHLVFDWNGRVASDTPRGQTTIAVLGLNRQALLEARAREAKSFQALVARASMDSRRANDEEQSASLREMTEELSAQTESSAPYAGMKRQLLRSSLSESFAAGIPELPLGWDQEKATVSKARRARAQKSLRDFEVLQSSYSLSDEAGRKLARSQQRTVERISLRHFKGVRHVDIDLVAEGSPGGWLMLLGENSTGKSSLLQAIALCIAGADYFAELVKDGRLIPKDLVNSRARRAVVTVKLAGFVDAHQMTVTASGASFKRPSGKTAEVVISDRGRVDVSGEDEARQGQLVLLGYGATRLLPRKDLPRYGQEFARIDNLFDAFLPLLDADRWLSRLKRKEFDGVALVLKDLLALEDDARMHRKLSRVYVRRHGDSAPVQRLSDGFQSVVAMSVDILEVATRLWGNPETAQGIVLLDEIGAHLHPTWKMRIVTSLRRAFPGMQFIATTHDPLCLRGLTKGEVVVMRRDEAARIEPVTDLPSPGDFRVDQLLTSEFFGLNSTVDPETEEIFDRYYALLALSERTPEQIEELERLQCELRDRRYVGDTLRDQLTFEAVDKVIAQHRAVGNLSMPDMKQAAADELAQLWKEVMAGLDGSRQ
ncbi:AAA family ATPase [Burkholderia pseudomallei]|uniref:AAA family ATPase n=1 Tax=Burkholderia pseudomallei TaxID=28450 RepID=UPI001AD6CA13|nr:AAA family ATPase [Burkholderia pseudomallei]MBO7832514.1 AAA family ATPase [Burkholderia pseudomallei]MBO7850999.1 AAA family ATPase [Burkholderia pseudomallei]